MSDPRLGFILQPTYRIESGRPVIHLWGTLESGESFLLRDDRLIPHFYVRASDAARAAELGARQILNSRRRSFAGDPMRRVEIATPPDTPALRERLHRGGVDTFEADVRFAMRYLIDRDIRGSLRISGHSRTAGRSLRVFENPQVSAAEWSPDLRVLSLDIETDPRGQRILSVGLWGCGAQEVILLTGEGQSCPPPAIPVSSEKELLESLSRRVRELDPDILTGWNVVDFDFAVLVRRAEDLGHDLALGRGTGGTRYRPGRSHRENSQVWIPGRLVLDGLHLLRGAFVRMERQSLDFVAREVLGEGKTLSGEAHTAEEILRRFESDRQSFVDYNLTDARLVLEILGELGLVELAVERSRLTGLPLDRVSSSVAAFDFLYLKELAKQRIVAPSVRAAERPAAASLGGGHVFEPEPGLYDQVLVLDFKSLYPSLIRTFQIDPLGLESRPQPETDYIVTPNGAHFVRRPGILTRLLDELIPRREEAKRAGRPIESLAIKILMNSFYGVLGTPVCRFYNPEIANAITSSGRHLLLESKELLEEWGHRVLYGDTDSLFVESGAGDSVQAQALGEELVRRLNQSLTRWIGERWGVESRLEIELEKVYARLFLPAVRHGTAGARKRYAGLIERAGRQEVEFTGLEAVRRDWTDLARRVQRDLYRRLFVGEEIEEYLAGVVASVRQGELDEQLVYRKALRKELDAYTSTTPPHVAAARKLSGPPGRLISYYMTVAGPEPVEQLAHAIDYQHYLEKQLRPVAEPVLTQLGLDFAKVIGDDRQLDLF